MVDFAMGAALLDDLPYHGIWYVRMCRHVLHVYACVRTFCMCVRHRLRMMSIYPTETVFWRQEGDSR